MNRRNFLRGAGCLMPLPFLNLMEASEKKINNGKPPVRFMSLFKPNGVHPPTWNINNGNEYDFQFSPLMKPFEKHKKDLLILDNLGNHGFSSHPNATRRFLCGSHSNTKQASMDQLIADKIGKSTSVRSLELAAEGLFIFQPNCSFISYDERGKPIPRKNDPQIVFDQLFRNPMSDPGKRKDMTSLLDRVSEDAKSLQRKAGKEDKDILDEYFTVVRETEKRLHNLNNANNSKINVSKLNRPAYSSNFDEQVNTMLDLIALAMWTDTTRCITYMLGNSNSRYVFDFLGITEQHHYLSHFFRNFSRKNAESLFKINLWHMEKFNYLLNRLKSYRDHNGTLLDNSIVLFGCGMGHSDSHTAVRVPTILAGNGGGFIKTGRYVRYSENQSMGKLHLSLLHKFGINVNNFGEDTETLGGLDSSDYKKYVVPQVETWMKINGNSIEVQGRLRISSNFNDANIFFVDLNDGRSVTVKVNFKNMKDFNLPYLSANGTAITLTGKGTIKSGVNTITEITKLVKLSS